MSGPLEDVNVLDAGVVGVGPWAASILAQLGADVIKVEPPGGDRIRQQLPLQGDVATTYSVVNLNKRSADIDLKDPELRPAVERLVRQADIVMDNQRPVVMERLRLDWQSVKAVNPRVVSVSASAWGDKGPFKDLPGLDYHMQMMSGYASLNGRPDDPGQILRYPHLDFNTSCFLAATALLGLLARERTGQGQRVVTTHLGSSVALLITRFAEYFATSHPPGPLGSVASATAPHRAFKCVDGRYVLVGVEDDGQFRAFCRATMLPDLGSDPRFADNPSRVKHRSELDRTLEPLFMSKPSRWWILRFENERVPCGTIKRFEELRHHQQVSANELLVGVKSPTQGTFHVGRPPWDFSRTRAEVGRPPTPGEHTGEVISQGFATPPASSRERPSDLPIARPPLEGIRVIDASQGYAGPLAGLFMAEAGAEVVKVEPAGGDRSRRFAPSCQGGDGAVFVALNRNKKTVELDLSAASEQQAFRSLAKKADVVIEDWGPGAADGLDCGYRALSRDHPDLIYCSITPYGEKGPYRLQPSSELITQGWAEYQQNLGAPGDDPERCGADIAGVGTGIISFVGILAALYYRFRNPGQGQRVDISSLGTMMFIKSALWAAVSNPDAWEGDDYCNSEIRGRWYGYRAKDRPIYFNLNNCTEEQYFGLLGELGMLDMALEDPRFGNAGRDAVGLGQYAREAQPVWEQYFIKKPAAEVVELINKHGGAAVPMLPLDEVFRHPQVAALNLFQKDREGLPYLGGPWSGMWQPVEVVPPVKCERSDGIWAAA